MKNQENVNSFESVLHAEYPYVAEDTEGSHSLCVWGRSRTSSGQPYTGVVCGLRDDRFLPTHYLIRNEKTVLLMRMKTYPCGEYREDYYTEREWDNEDPAAIRWEDDGIKHGVQDGDQFFALPEEAIERMGR